MAFSIALSRQRVLVWHEKTNSCVKSGRQSKSCCARFTKSQANSSEILNDILAENVLLRVLQLELIYEEAVLFLHYLGYNYVCYPFFCVSVFLKKFLPYVSVLLCQRDGLLPSCDSVSPIEHHCGYAVTSQDHGPAHRRTCWRKKKNQWFTFLWHLCRHTLLPFPS